MKPQILFVSAVFLASGGAWAGTQEADTGVVYIGVRGGPSSTNMDSSELTRRLQQRGQNVTATVDHKDVFGSVYLGYRFHPNASVELGANHAGKFETSIAGSPTSAKQLADDVSDLVRGSGNAVSLDLRLDIPVAGPLDLNSRFGAYAWRTQVEVSSAGTTAKHNEDGLGGRIGLGFTLNLPAYFRIGVGYDLTLPTPSQTIGAFYAQLEYGLGDIF